MKIIKSVTLVTLFFVSFPILAQSPKQISYQAVIRDANNELLQNKALGVQISILKNSIEGDAIYIETHTIVTNDNGLLTLSIGSGAMVSGDFQELDWTNGSHFIKIDVDPNGGTSYNITHTSQLLSVPYALHANTADSVAGGVSQRLGLKLNDNELMITNDEASLPVDLSKYLGEIANLTAAERDSISSPKTGTIIFCTDCNEMQYYDSRQWLNFYGQYGSGADTIRPIPIFEDDWEWIPTNKQNFWNWYGLSGQSFNSDTVKFRVGFRETVDDFTAEDILYNNGEVIDFKLDKAQGGPRYQSYKVTVLGNQTEGKHYITIAENAATDIVGNLSTIPDTLGWFYDSTIPVPTITVADYNGNGIAEGAITGKSYVQLKISFNEPLDYDYSFPNAFPKVTGAGFWQQGYDYQNQKYELNMNSPGEVIIEIPDSSFMDLASNINIESYRFSFKYGTEEDFQDGDGDGVFNHMDQCADTPAGAVVDMYGCTRYDTDGDGVYDDEDSCPNTSAGAAVNAVGCPDTDGDGVYDDEDLCPNTPAGAAVNAVGCPDTDGDGVDDNKEFVIGNYKLLPRAGAFAVGPAPDDLSWYSNSYDDVLYGRSCQFDDIYSFKDDGTFEINMGESTLLEYWQTNYEVEGCGEPVAPFDGNGTYTWTADSSGTLTVSGAGAFIGLPKVHNDGELPNVAHPGTVTYEYSTSYDAEGYKILTLLIEYNKAAWWQFTLVDESYPFQGVPKVTFHLDFSSYLADSSKTETVPYLNGTFNGWCGDCNPMTDEDGNGVYDITIPLTDGDYEFKFTAGGWNDQELFNSGTEGTIGDEFVNRFIIIAETDVTYGPYCWNTFAETCE